MRSSTFCSRNCVRRVTVAKRKAIHSCRIWPKPFCRGRPSPPIITRLIEALDSSEVCASSMLHEFGLVLVLRLRLEHQPHRRVAAGFVAHGVEQRQHRLLHGQLLGATAIFLPSRIFGLVSSSISSSTFCDEVPGGSSVTTSLPLAARQVFDLPARAHLQRCRGRSAYISAMRRRRGDDLAAAGKVGAGHQSPSARRAAASDCGSARPPPAPLRAGCATGSRWPGRPRCRRRRSAARNGRRAGSSFGSSVEPS